MAKSSADWVREIIQQIIEKKFKAALTNTESALKEHGDDSQVIGYRGVVEILTGERQKGIQSLKHAYQALQKEVADESDEDFKKIFKSQLNNMGTHLFDAADGSVAQTSPLELAKLLIEDVGWMHRRAVKTLAIDAINNGQAQVAIDLLKPVLDSDANYDSGWYNIACAYAQLGQKSFMLEAVKKAIQTSRSEAAYDVRPDLKDDEDFSGYRNDPDFIALVSPLPNDPTLLPTYKLLQEGLLDKVLTQGEDALAQATDRLAILEAMFDAAQRIDSDIDEHGEEFSEYKHQQVHYREVIQRLKTEIFEEKKKGAKSSVFRSFKSSQ